MSPIQFKRLNNALIKYTGEAAKHQPGTKKRKMYDAWVASIRAEMVGGGS